MNIETYFYANLSFLKKKGFIFVHSWRKFILVNVWFSLFEYF